MSHGTGGSRPPGREHRVSGPQRPATPLASRVPPAALWCAFLATLLYPIASTPWLPLVDLPKHLARVRVLSDYQASELFRQTFELSWAPIPNLALDLALLPLMDVLGPSLAMRVFVGGTALLFAVGCLQLQRAITGRWTLLGIAAAYFFYSAPLYFGFVNYMAGVALFMIALAHWVRHSKSVRPGFLLASSLLAALCYLTHLVSYAAFAVALLWYSWPVARDRSGVRTGLIRLLPLAPPLLAFAVFMGHEGRVGTVELNSVAGKIVGLFPWLIGYDYTWDALLAGVLVIGLAVIMVRGGPPKVQREGVELSLVFLGLFLVTPKVVLTSSAADARWVLPGILALVLSVHDGGPEHARGPSWRTAIGPVALVLLVFQAGRLASVTRAWHHLSARTEAQVRDVLPLVPLGSRVLSVYVPSRSPETEKRERGLRSNAHYATVLRGAVVSDPFALPGAQPVVLRPGALPHIRRGRPADMLAAGWPHYDHAWIHGELSAGIMSGIRPFCPELTSASGVLLCRLRPASLPGTAPPQP